MLTVKLRLLLAKFPTSLLWIPTSSWSQKGLTLIGGCRKSGWITILPTLVKAAGFVWEWSELKLVCAAMFWRPKSNSFSLAYAELFITIAAVFRKFDLEMYETTIDDIKIERDLFVASPKLGSKGVRGFVKRVLKDWRIDYFPVFCTHSGHGEWGILYSSDQYKSVGSSVSPLEMAFDFISRL